jgi:hypothetical protein
MTFILSFSRCKVYFALWSDRESKNATAALAADLGLCLIRALKSPPLSRLRVALSTCIQYFSRKVIFVCNPWGTFVENRNFKWGGVFHTALMLFFVFPLSQFLTFLTLFKRKWVFLQILYFMFCEFILHGTVSAWWIFIARTLGSCVWGPLKAWMFFRVILLSNAGRGLAPGWPIVKWVLLCV